MAKKKKAEEASEESEDAGGGGGGNKMVPAAMISIALVAAGYFVGGRGGSAAPVTAETIVTVVEAEPEVGEIINLEPINVNLADGHYLRVAISIGMEAHHEESGGEEAASGHGAAATETVTTEPTAPAADLVLSTFAGKPIEELSTLEGRIAARDHLLEGLREFYGEEVLTVFFTEFVMQ